MRSSVLCFDLGRLCQDETFIFKAFHIFANGILAHTRGFAYRCITRMALERFSILAVHQIGVYNDLACGKVESEDGFRQRKVIAGDITLVGIAMIQSCTSRSQKVKAGSSVTSEACAGIGVRPHNAFKSSSQSLYSGIARHIL